MDGAGAAAGACPRAPPCAWPGSVQWLGLLLRGERRPLSGWVHRVVRAQGRTLSETSHLRTVRLSVREEGAVSSGGCGR